MIAKLTRYLKQLRSRQRMNMAFARAAATSALRRLDPTDPVSWEFSAFSQNGEDGILDELTRRLTRSNRYFIEIGASDGLENNTTWLALGRRFSGLWIEGDQDASERCRDLMSSLNYGVETLNLFVTRESASQIRDTSRHADPDVFSLDVDGNDYHLSRALLDTGLRPKIWVVEYNSAFGPESCVTIPYRRDFRVLQKPGDSLYYGCSVGAYRKLFEAAGYRFVSVDSNGVNAFFVDPGVFDPGFLTAIRGLEFRENTSHGREYHSAWPEQWKRIQDREFVDVSAGDARRA